MPRIKHLSFPAALYARGLPEEQMPATTPLCGELLVCYAFDLPGQFVIATPPHLARAGISAGEMSALALRNLARQMPAVQQLRKRGCTALQTGGQLEATLLLLDGFWQQLQADLGGSIVAVAPRRDRLLVCDGNDASALAQLDVQAQQFFTEVQDAHALSTQKMLRRDGRWELLEPH